MASPSSTRIPHILINQLCFTLPNSTVLFDTLILLFSYGKKIGLVGKNGIGKSTLLKLITGELMPSAGSIQVEGTLTYVPQQPLIAPHITVAGFLGVEEKLHAYQRIIQGNTTTEDLVILNEEWDVEQQIQQKLQLFSLTSLPYDRPLSLLSGGEITRLCLTQAFSSHADFMLLDEPTNHLDLRARTQLYKLLTKWQGGLIVVSHDRALLNRMDSIIELNTLGAHVYGGYFDFYMQQKEIEKEAAEQQLLDAKKSLKKASHSTQASKEKHEQRQAKGRNLRRSGSQASIILDGMQERSDKSLSGMSTRHHAMMKHAEERVQSAQKNVEILEEIHVSLPKTSVPSDKILLQMKNVRFAYPQALHPLIDQFTLTLKGATRIALKGENGSGKTTLIKLILGQLTPQLGTIYVGTEYVSYLDQSLQQLDPAHSILDNFMQMNPESTKQEAHASLASFLFRNVAANTLVKNLSGGEKLRAMLACVLMASHPPQLLILDEPTNHLDLDSVRAIESALTHYLGAMIVVSHDEIFLQNIGITESIRLSPPRHKYN